MRSLVFLGPSLPIAAAKNVCDAEFHPPAQQGDVLKALKRETAAILLIDGYFESVPSVWHKELLVALESGVHVLGAASMGALRAAELDSFGMRGLGQVYEWYRDGTIEDDDEVAVTHGHADADYRPASVAMVELRAAAADLVRSAQVTPREAQGVLGAAKDVYFAYRTWRAIRERVRSHKQRALVDLLESKLCARLASVKARDSLLALRTLQSMRRRPPPHFVPKFATQRTVFLEALVHEVDNAYMADAVPTREPALPETLVTQTRREAAAQNLVISHRDLLKQLRITYDLAGGHSSAGKIDPRFQSLVAREAVATLAAIKRGRK